MAGTFAVTLYTENMADDLEMYHTLIESWKKIYGPLHIHVKLEYIVNGTDQKITADVDHLKGSVVAFFARMAPFREKKLTIIIKNKT